MLLKLKNRQKLLSDFIICCNKLVQGRLLHAGGLCFFRSATAVVKYADSGNAGLVTGKDVRFL